jgi:hypothetical protein
MADNRESWGVVRSTDRDPAQLVIRSRSRLCNREDSPIRICVLRCWVFDAEGFMIAVTSDQRIIPPPNGPADRNLEVCKRIKTPILTLWLPWALMLFRTLVVLSICVPFLRKSTSSRLNGSSSRWIVVNLQVERFPVRAVENSMGSTHVARIPCLVIGTRSSRLDFVRW